MSKALKMKDFEDRCKQLAKDIDRFKYSYSLIQDVGKPLASALNDLASARVHLKEAASEQAFEELAEKGNV